MNTLHFVPTKPTPPRANDERRVTLDDVKPAVWRSFRFPINAPLRDDDESTTTDGNSIPSPQR